MLKKYLVPVLISLIFFFSYAKISLELYHAHQTRGDLTAYAQGMWNTVHGHFMASTYNYSVHNFYDKQFREITADNSNILGIHFNPVLLLFVPIYAAFPTPETLLIIQAFLVAAGGFLIYLLAQHVLRSRLLSLVIEASYLLYVATVSAVLSQFHAYTLALFFGPLLILAARKLRTFSYYLCLFLFLFVQENTSLVATVFGLSLALVPATRKRGILTILISGLYFVLIIGHIIPALSPYHFYLFSGIYGNKLGGNIPEIILGALRHPELLVESIITPVNLTYLGHLLVGVFPFALLSPPMLLVALSSLAQNILSTSLGLKTGAMHYESGSVPFLFYALILGVNLALTKTKLATSRYGVAICVASILIMTGISYKQFTSQRLNPTLLTLSLYTERDSEMDALLKQIPGGASVATQDYLSAQLAGREGLYQFPVYAERADYLLLATDNEVWPLTSKEQQEKLHLLTQDRGVEKVAQSAHFILFKRKK